MGYKITSGEGIHEYTIGSIEKIEGDEYVILQLTVPMRSVSNARYNEALSALKSLFPDTKTDKFLIIGSDVNVYTIPTKEAMKLRLKGLL